MGKKLYPPYIENKLPAFTVNGSICIPFKLNRIVHPDEFDKVSVMIKSIQTGDIKEIVETGNIQYKESYQQHEAYILPEQLKVFKPESGQYYRIQIACIEKSNDKIIGHYSDVGVIKCTNKPVISIDGLDEGVNTNRLKYVGTYSNNDSTEKVYWYQFDLWDQENVLVASSGQQIHNSATDESTTSSYDTWVLEKSLEKNKYYYLTYSIITNNGFSSSSPRFSIRDFDTVNIDINSKLVATFNYDDGYVGLKLIPENPDKTISGSYSVSRHSNEDDSWHEIYKFNVVNQKVSQMDELWRDYTVQQGITYTYAIQKFNANNLYSNRLTHTNSDGTKTPICIDFEDAFLFDGKRQLKIRYNPKVSSFKSTVLESKVDTLGGQFPFIFRNGNVDYKEFPISGLLSYLTDINGLFLPLTLEDGFMTNLSGENMYNERQFKMEALEWLNNGQPKLFRSPAEGNHIIRLMNVSLTPVDTISRMLHSFNSTAYEIAEYNYSNLNHYGFIEVPEIEKRAMKFAQTRIEDFQNILPSNIYGIRITNAVPASIYELTIGKKEPVSIEIGATGNYYISNLEEPLVNIRLISGLAGQATLEYGYYDTAVPDNFDLISDVKSSDEISAMTGLGIPENENQDYDLITKNLEDIRRQVGIVHYMRIMPRLLVKVELKNGEWHYAEKDGGVLNPSITEIYYTDENHFYEYLNNEMTGKNSSKIKRAYDEGELYKVYLKQIGLPAHGLDLSVNNVYNSPEGKLEDKTLIGSPIIYSIGNYSRYEYYNFPDLVDIYASYGIYIELAYQLKEIEYSVEDETDIKETKENWLKAKEQLKNGENSMTQAEVNRLYSIYIDKLENRLVLEEEYHAL